MRVRGEDLGVNGETILGTGTVLVGVEMDVSREEAEVLGWIDPDMGRGEGSGSEGKEQGRRVDSCVNSDTFF